MYKYLLVFLALVGGLTQAQTIGEPPICYPNKLRFDVTDVPTTVSTKYTFNVTYGCETPTLVVSYGYLIEPADYNFIIQSRNKTKAEQDAAYRQAASTTPITTAEVGFWAANLAKWGGSLTVAPSSLSSRPVYTYNPTTKVRNTLAIPNQRVATTRVINGVTYPQRCWGYRLLDSTGKPTSYHSVKGLPNVATADPNDVLGDYYALCTLVPPPMGWN
jgi:hypothetical protein